MQSMLCIMEHDEPLLSISNSEGVRMHVQKGDKIAINASKVSMSGVNQHATGGVIEQRASNELVQTGNIMKSGNGGTILNEVRDGGLLRQNGNQMNAQEGGTIINRVFKKKSMVLGVLSALLVILGASADVITLMSTGGHLWELRGTVSIHNSTLTQSPILVNSPNSKVVYEDAVQIPMDRRLWIPFSNFKRYDGQPVKAIFNLLYNLPNGKQAFIESFPKDGAVLFYSNDDCSEIYVPEKYRRSDILMDEICWIDEAGCGGLNLEKPIARGPKAIADIESCIQ